MQRALGEGWHKLPPVLQAHYRFGVTTDIGHLDIEYPRFMQPYLCLLSLFGALVNRGGRHLRTVVEKSVASERHVWRRTISYPDGKNVHFNSFWIYAGGNQLIEFVNPVLGLQVAIDVEDGRLYYRGRRFVIKLGKLLLPVPEWLVLGHTTIVEMAVDDTRFEMDFRLTHPLLGQVFRYSGTFETSSTNPAAA